MTGKRRLLRRSMVLLSVLVTLTILFTYFIIRESVLIDGTDVGTDELKRSALNNAARNSVIEGSIYDSEGTLITQADETGVSGECRYPSFSYLIGYNNGETTFGLRGRYQKHLHTGVVGQRGADMKLTARADIQEKAASILSASGMSGSIIVLDVKSGRIIALASRRGIDFNVNTLSENYKLYSEQKDFFYPPGYKDADPPGSTFKMITASAMLENGMAGWTYNDTGEAVFDGVALHNARNGSYGNIGLQTALSKSVNTYFATAAVELGPDALEKKAREFLIGEDIELDFTTLHSNFDLGSGSDLLTAATGFGQGRLLMTPLHIAMAAQSIANDGVMLKPWLVESIKLDKKVLLEGKTVRLGRTMKRGTASRLRELLHNTAVDQYGLKEKKYGDICAKTGTAELGSGCDHIYFVAFNERYVVMCSANDTNGLFGSSLVSWAKEMYGYLADHPYYYRENN